jgi:hypothetical protein
MEKKRKNKIRYNITKYERGKGTLSAQNHAKPDKVPVPLSDKLISLIPGVIQFLVGGQGNSQI